MRIPAAILAITASLGCAGAADAAAIVGVVTESGARINVGPSTSGAFSRSFSGDRLRESLGFGARQSVAFDSTADVDDGYIFFSNGNTSSGVGIGATSRTVVEVTVTNTGSTAIPFTQLDTVIIPAEIGFFVTNRNTGCDPAQINTCTLKASDFVEGIALARSFGSRVLGSIARSSFDYRVTSEGETLFALSSSLELLDAQGRPDTFTNLVNIFTAGAEDVLANFRQTGGLSLNGANRFIVPEGDNAALGGRFGYAWDETPVTLTGFGDGTLAAGASRTFIFTTQVTTRTDNDCDPSDLRPECVGAFGSFGDPLGDKRGSGGTGPGQRTARSLATAGANGVDYGFFRFDLPTFSDDGTLVFDQYIEVAEPGAFGLFGCTLLALGAARRRRGGRATPA